MASSLSAAARSVWAKSVDDAGRWLPLWRHMDDSAEIANALFDGWLAPSCRELLAAEFGGDVDQARVAVRFLAGLHDIGKATPAFAVQCTVLAQRMCDQGLYLPLSKSALPDRHLTHHSVAGHHLVIRWLVGHGWMRRAARAWGVVLGGHHGVPPAAEDEHAARPDGLEKLYGENKWDDVQRELLDRMAYRSGAASHLPGWRDIRLSARFQVLATALVIVSDWIASNSDLLTFLSGKLPLDVESPRRVQRALETLRLPRPWLAKPAGIPPVQLFASRFRLPAGASARPVQLEVCDIAGAMPEPGILVVEAPMGEGKTEAALAAAEIMAARWGAGGMLVALPTQATTDAMFARVVSWLEALGAEDEEVGGSIVLGHGRARLNKVFQGLVRAGRLAQIGCDDPAGRHAVVAHGWLSGRKKALLANFAVVTIDQVLFAGLKARHLMLRHLALAGKVVVIDEIHAYDAYMNSYLAKVLTWLGAYRVPVVALSATLPADQRRALVEAYRRASGHDDPAALSGLDGDIGYPVLTWSAGASLSTRRARPSGRSTTVEVHQFERGIDDLDDLVEVLRDALADGGTALVVRNTVRRVLDTAHRLDEVFPGEVSVLHSRFIAADRMRKDSQLLDSFGPPDRAIRRPDRHIVVASQVVEQSLDVDFDLLVTDLAPIDLVLQRMGRLHRHQRGDNQEQRPERVRTARLFVTGAEFTLDPPEFEQAAERYVYDTDTLLRAAAVLREHVGGHIRLPDDIAPLVQRAYGAEEIGPDSWQSAMLTARDKRRERTERREGKAEVFQIADPGAPGRPISGWVSAGVGEADDTGAGQGQVRDGAPSLEVLLVCEDDGRWWTPSWLDADRGLPIPQQETPPDRLAEVMASCVLRLPLTFSNADAEDELWRATPPGWEDSPLIYRQPVLAVDRDGWGEIIGRRVRYTPERGLEVFGSDE